MNASAHKTRLSPQVSPRKLKLAFLALGVLLLSSLGFLAKVASDRLAEARRDREGMVASRVFDEMEREVSAFLETENERPHYTALENTNPENWAPFVVGYFSGPVGAAPEKFRVVVAEGPTSEHRRRMNWALERARQNWFSSTAPQIAGDSTDDASETGDPRGAAPSPSQQAPIFRSQPPQHTTKKDVALEEEKGEREQAQKSPAPVQQKAPSGSAIIESLNRAPERRKTKPKSPAPSKSEDQFSDYLEAY